MISIISWEYLPHTAIVTTVIILACYARLKLIGWLKAKHIPRLKITKSNGVISPFARLPSKGRETARVILVLLILVVGIASLLGINFERVELASEREGADIVFLADATNSMFAPSKVGSFETRWDVMMASFRGVIDVLEKQKQKGQKNRVGIIAFGWDAWNLIRYPTDDYTFLRNVALAKLDTTFVYEHGRKGSNLGAAIIEGVKIFLKVEEVSQRIIETQRERKTDVFGEEQSTIDRKKILIAVTDGEPWGDIEKINKIISMAYEIYSTVLEIDMFILGVGDPDEYVPIYEKNFFGDIVGVERDREGREVATKPDFDFLQGVAERSDGTFISASESTSGELEKKILEIIDNTKKTGKKIEETVVYDITLYMQILYCLLIVLLFVKFRN